MKVTRKTIHEDLSGFSLYWTMNILRYLVRGKRRLKIMSAIAGRVVRENAPTADASIKNEKVYLPTRDGEARFRVRIYKPTSASTSEKLPAMLYTHGGGYVTGSPEEFEGIIKKFVECRPCIVVAPAYRNALTKPYPAAFDDCYDTLLWMRDNANDLGIDPSKFMIAGHSAGGGLTAAITLKARDTKDVKLAFQMPIYPMIDDQQPNDPKRYIDVPGWDTKANAFGWKSYLKDLHQSNAEIPPYAAPARNTDYTDFPPTITFVGEFDPFCGETIEYVDRLRSAGVDVAFKTYEKCTHGHELMAPSSSVGKDALAFTYDNYAAFYDKYVAE